jgi:hypothetical protein
MVLGKRKKFSKKMSEPFFGGSELESKIEPFRALEGSAKLLFF